MLAASAAQSAPTEAEFPRAVLFRLCGIAFLLVAFVALALIGRSPPVAAFAFVSCLAVAWLGYGIFFSNGRAISPISVRVALFAAIALRVAGLATAPIYEDDWARYLWDGYRFLEDGSPYVTAPSDYLEDADIDAPWHAILAEVNNPDVPTIYAPGLQYVFALTSWLAPTSLLGLKVILIVFDLGVWVTLCRLGGTAAGLRYALCPLVVFEVAFNAHADIVGASLAVACYALVRSRRDVAAGVAFGLALACKPFAVIVAPALLNRRWPIRAGAALGVLGLLYAPFVWTGATEFAGMAVFSRWWEFNSLGFAVLKLVFDGSIVRPLALVLGVSLSASLMLYWRLREANTFPPADLWLLALLFFAPVVNPWYLLWAVPWACLRANALTWAVLPAVSISYLTSGVLGIDGPGFYDHPSWVRLIEVLVGVGIYLPLRMLENRSMQNRPV